MSFLTQLVLEKIYKNRKLYWFVIARSSSKCSQLFNFLCPGAWIDTALIKKLIIYTEVSLQIHFSVSIGTLNLTDPESGRKTTPNFKSCLVKPGVLWPEEKLMSPESLWKTLWQNDWGEGLFMAGFCGSCLPPDNTRCVQPWFQICALGSGRSSELLWGLGCSGAKAAHWSRMLRKWILLNQGIGAPGWGHLRGNETKPILHLSNILRQRFGFNHKLPLKYNPRSSSSTKDHNIQVVWKRFYTTSLNLKSELELCRVYG